MPGSAEKKPLLLLGYDPIDEDHRDFMAIIEDIMGVDNVGFATMFEALLSHTEAHFERENKLMEASGYPAMGEHRGEHARVMGEFKQFHQRVKRGLIPFGRAFVAERLLPWFELHITTMDAALAAHLRASHH
ncbi:MAG: hemerythrin [Pseudomonadales bacterium]|nr:hemerythrin [Pseudomonadales bacterium]MEC8812394.1 hemerythrin domain-containing protein [Pseudomonadota bacterium]TNC85820.1 MAG: hemerythrin [Alcanivorax sp.]HAG93869.1 hemerythrin [Gammaproteobacteria bacterium]MBI27707.1 hemerythrin [Pseudomonadales bacterium]|tara:strand:+ start:8484 stop:8879 length:396 start_codon:yes stop_codon:yes gene_type:complete